MTNSSMYNVKAIFEPCELRFSLDSSIVLTSTMLKKLKTMGFPKIKEALVLTKRVNTLANGVVTVDFDSCTRNMCLDGTAAQDICYFQIIMGPEGDGHFKITYSPSDKSILLTLNGTFYSVIWSEIHKKHMENADCVYIGGFTLKDEKGKEINGPKDEYGYSTPLVARPGTNHMDRLQVPVKFIVTPYAPCPD
jgi:hypothetical protein